MNQEYKRVRCSSIFKIYQEVLKNANLLYKWGFIDFQIKGTVHIMNQKVHTFLFIFFLDKEALRFLLKNNYQGDFSKKITPAEPATDEMMLRDNDNTRVLIERLDRDLEKTKHRLENKTKTVDRLLDQLDLKNKAIQDLKVDAERRCESKIFFLTSSRCLTIPTFKSVHSYGIPSRPVTSRHTSNPCSCTTKYY